MAGTGGKREGAGRKPGSLGGNSKLAEALRAAFIVEYRKRKNGIWKALLDRAEQGDVPAIKEANERAMGKVKDTIDVNNPDGNLKTIIINKNGSNNQPPTKADGSMGRV